MMTAVRVNGAFNPTGFGPDAITAVIGRSIFSHWMVNRQLSGSLAFDCASALSRMARVKLTCPLVKVCGTQSCDQAAFLAGAIWRSIKSESAALRASLSSE